MQIWLMGLGDRVKKYFGFIYFVIVIIGIVWLFNYLSPTSRKIRMLEKLSREYGGVYVFYPEFREEIKKRERERKELFEKIKDEISSNPRLIKDSDGEWKTIYDTDFTRINEALPQTLSNGCKYHNQAFAPYNAIFEPYYEKIKEFVGEEAYKRLKPSLRITSSYRCEGGDGVIITIYTAIGTTYTEFGIFGNEGTGVYFSQDVDINIGGSNTFELRDGKFVKVDKKSRGLR